MPWRSQPGLLHRIITIGQYLQRRTALPTVQSVSLKPVVCIVELPRKNRETRRRYIVDRIESNNQMMINRIETYVDSISKANAGAMNNPGNQKVISSMWISIITIVTQKIIRVLS